MKKIEVYTENSKTVSRDEIAKKARKKIKLICDGNRNPCIVETAKQFIYPPML